MTRRAWSRSRRRGWWWHPVPRTLARAVALVIASWLVWQVVGWVADGAVAGAQGAPAPVACLAPLTGGRPHVSRFGVLTSETVQAVNRNKVALRVTVDTYRDGHLEYRDTQRIDGEQGDPVHIRQREQLPASWDHASLRVVVTVKATCSTRTGTHTLSAPDVTA